MGDTATPVPVQRTTAAQSSTPPAGPTPPPTTTSNASPQDAGASPDANAPAKKNVAACLAACEAKYPNGALKAKLIDQCWSDHCGACQTMAGGTLHAPTTGACQQPVWTPSADCSQCTADWCCWAWDGCFGDAECTALNDCANACSN